MTQSGSNIPATTNAPMAGSPPTPPTTGARHALIFVQGVGLGIGPRKTAAGVMTNLERACEEQTEAAAQFSVHWHDAAVREKATGLVATLQRVESGRQDPVLDLYSYEWSDTFISKWRDQNVFKRLLKVVWSLTRVGPFFRFFRTSGKKNPLGRTQLLLAGVMVVVLALYAVVTAIAAYQAIDAVIEMIVEQDDNPAIEPETTSSDVAPGGSVPDVSTPSESEDAPDPVAEGDTDAGADGGLSLSQWIAVIGGLVIILSKRLRQGVVSVGEALAASHAYLQIDAGKNHATLGLTELIEDVSAQSTDTEIAILAYSFGALVAIDTLFPTTGPPPKLIERVGTLVTIGTPFDFARAVRRKWTEQRHVGTGSLEEWINIFSPIDLFGSNFRQNTKGDQPDMRLAQQVTLDGTGTTGAGDQVFSSQPPIAEPSINESWGSTIENSLSNLVAFHGFTSHGAYWSEAGDETSVFQLVVSSVYSGSAVLATPEATGG